MKRLMVLLAILIALPANIVSADFNQTSTTGYLTDHSASPWVTMALKTLGYPNIPSDHLKNISGSAAIEYAAPILAITALGQDPRLFGGSDYVAALKSFATGGQIGDSSTLNDDFFGILALRSAGEPANSTIISNTKNFILNQQNSDGGWGFTVTSESDTNMTSAAILALLAGGLTSSDSAITNAVAYLQAAQNSDGGFPYSAGFESDTASTAWVAWALNALNINLASWPKNTGTPQSYLEAAQTEAGYFTYQNNSGEDSFTPITTAYAVLALKGKYLPLTIFSQPVGVQVAFRIEGSVATLCQGQTTAVTALEVVKRAASLCALTYNIQDTAYGPYLNQIEGDLAQGLTGWLYLVNWQSPNVGAADYELLSNDEVLWFYGDFDWLPTRLNVSDGDQPVATVEYLNNSSWSALGGAELQVGNQTLTTNVSGQAELNLPDGWYTAQAHKEGYIRSQSEKVKIGQPAEQSISLNVTVENPGVQGIEDDQQTVAFIIEPDQLEFGSLKPGQSAEQQLTASNTGQVPLVLETIVTGDDLFTGQLKIDSQPWQTFQAQLETSGQSQVQVSLKVPDNYATIGQRSAQLIFWAQAQ